LYVNGNFFAQPGVGWADQGKNCFWQPIVNILVRAFSGCPWQKEDLDMLQAYSFVRSRLGALRRDEKGVTALEYGVIAAVVIVVGLAAFTTIGPTLQGVFTTVNTSLTPP
jgi:pilus assembly protein Flp/PilA